MPKNPRISLVHKPVSLLPIDEGNVGGHCVDEELQRGKGALQLGGRFPPLGDIVRDPEHPDDFALRVSIGHRVRLHPAPRALQPNEGKLAAASLPLHRAPVHFQKCGTISGHDEIAHRATAHFVERLGLDHVEPRRIHLQQLAIRRKELHAFRLQRDDQAEVLLALVERELGLFALRDVALDSEKAGHRAALVAHRRHEQRIPEGRAVLAIVLNFPVEETLAPHGGF